MQHESPGCEVYVECTLAPDEFVCEDVVRFRRVVMALEERAHFMVEAPVERNEVPIDTGVGQRGRGGLISLSGRAYEWHAPCWGEATVAALAAAPAIGVGVYQLLKVWMDARNGRKLKIKVGDIEVEATQMNEQDVLRIFELLEEKADRKKIRELLLEAGKDGGRPEGH